VGYLERESVTGTASFKKSPIQSWGDARFSGTTIQLMVTACPGATGLGLALSCTLSWPAVSALAGGSTGCGIGMSPPRFSVVGVARLGKASAFWLTGAADCGRGGTYLPA
jgi:hypothetical protein